MALRADPSRLPSAPTLGEPHLDRAPARYQTSLGSGRDSQSPLMTAILNLAVIAPTRWSARWQAHHSRTRTFSIRESFRQRRGTSRRFQTRHGHGPSLRLRGPFLKHRHGLHQSSIATSMFAKKPVWGCQDTKCICSGRQARSS